jgi:hypothetical protein
MERPDHSGFIKPYYLGHCNRGRGPKAARLTGQAALEPPGIGRLLINGREQICFGTNSRRCQRLLSRSRIAILSEGQKASANGTYHGTKATVEGRIYQDNHAVTGDIAVEGAAVLADGGVFFGNQIYDSFAVVDAGAPNVSVEYENRYAGKTDSSGKLLLPQLRSFQSNKVSIDVNDLPLTAAIGDSEEVVVPRDMSGVVVDFGVKMDEAAALVTLTDVDGKRRAAEVMRTPIGHPAAGVVYVRSPSVASQPVTATATL